MAQAPAPKSRATIEREEKATARRDAQASFKAGNPAAAVAMLAATTQKWSKAESQEVDLGRQLANISFTFHNEGNSALAASVAELSLNRLASPEGKVAPKDAAKALTLAGGIYEHVQGDLVRARQAYERALLLEPASVHVKERLARIAAVEAAARDKAIANQMLAQRRAERGNR